MGMYDTLRCDMPLPSEAPLTLAGHQFQTKDMVEFPMLTEYRIAEDGTLWLHHSGVHDEPNVESTRVPYEGPLNFYTITRDRQWWEFDADFERSVCIGIRLVENSPLTPNITIA